MQVTTIGLDIAKNVFQLHGVDSTGRECFFGKYGGISSCRYWEPAAMSDWHGSLRDGASLGTPTGGSWA